VENLKPPILRAAAIPAHDVVAQLAEQAHDVVAQLAELSVSLDAEAGEGTDEGSVGPTAGAVAKPVWTDKLDAELRRLVDRYDCDFGEVARGLARSLAPAVAVTPKDCTLRYAGLESAVGGAGVEGTCADSSEATAALDQGNNSSSTASSHATTANPAEPANEPGQPLTPAALLAPAPEAAKAGTGGNTASAPATSSPRFSPKGLSKNSPTSLPARGKRAQASLSTTGDDAEAPWSAKKACLDGAGSGGGAGLLPGAGDRTGGAAVEGAGTGGAGMARAPVGNQAAAGPGDGGAGAAVEPDDVVATLRRLMATLGVWVEKLSK
jgi:hypothetical protein